MQAAHGRWREILPLLGVPSIFLNGKHQPCPACGGKDRARFDDRHGDGDYFCGQCGAGKGISLLMKCNGWDFVTAARCVDEIIGNLPPTAQHPEFRATTKTNAQSLRRLWLSSQRVSGSDAVTTYLHARRITGPVPTALRFVPSMTYYRDGKRTAHPGMIALFSDADGRPNTLHRTYLTTDGDKAALDPCRVFMPSKIAQGGAIRLAAAADVLGIAEGIETALSAAIMFKLPVWATTSEGLLRAWQPPEQTKRVVIFGDNDVNFVGQAAAHALASRLIFDAQRDQRDLDVEVKIPGVIGHDWNDVLREKGMTHARIA
ncbi:MAG TPA: toprim domain-containing protein [Bradyrhizobium sp.]